MRVLLDVILRSWASAPFVDLQPPLRVRRQQVVKEGQLERHVELLANRVGHDGAILVLLDADDDCPAQLAPELLARARSARPDRKISVVLAVREYEAWLLASLETLRGYRGIPADAAPPDDPEAGRSPKSALAALMPQGYAETVDQPGLTSHIDVEHTRRRSPSFDKLVRDVTALVAK